MPTVVAQGSALMRLSSSWVLRRNRPGVCLVNDVWPFAEVNGENNVAVTRSSPIADSNSDVAATHPISVWPIACNPERAAGAESVTVEQRQLGLRRPR